MSDALITEPKKKPGYNLKGRPKGVRNKVTREIRAIATDYGPAAVRKLAVLGTWAGGEVLSYTTAAGPTIAWTYTGEPYVGIGVGPTRAAVDNWWAATGRVRA